jgi:hypothetical protein
MTKRFSKKRSFAKKTDRTKLPNRNQNTTKPRFAKKPKIIIISVITMLVTPIILLLLWFGFVFFSIRFSSLPKALGDFPASDSWNGKTQLNLLIVVLSDLKSKTADVTDLYLIEVNELNESIRLLRLPVTITVEVAQGMGKYRLENVFALGAIKDKKENMSLLKTTLEKELAIQIDRYLAVDNQTAVFLEDNLASGNWGELPEPLDVKLPQLLADYRQKCTGITAYFSLLKVMREGKTHFQTNLSGNELSALCQNVGRVEEAKFSISVLPDDFYLEEQTEDGQYVQILDQVKLDFFMQNNFYDYGVRQERLKVKVYNGSTIPKVAAKAARFVVNSGAEVIEIDNAEEVSQTQIIANETHRNSETVRRYRALFEGKVVVTPIDSVEREDIKIVVGKAWAQTMEGGDEGQ